MHKNETYNNQIKSLIEEIKRDPSGKPKKINTSVIKKTCMFLRISDLDALLKGKKINKERINKLLRIKKSVSHKALINFYEHEDRIWDDDKIDNLINTIKENLQ